MRAAALLPVLALAACAAPPGPIAVFACPGLGDVSVRHGDGDGVFEAAGRRFTLPRAPAASGVRYQKGADQFWEHQGMATVDLDGRHAEGCKPK